MVVPRLSLAGLLATGRGLLGMKIFLVPGLSKISLAMASVHLPLA